MCAHRIFASFDPRRPRNWQRHTHRSKHQCRFELSKEEASLRGFKAKPELEDPDPFGELAVASLILPRVKAPIVEGPAPLLPVVAWRNDQAGVGRSARAWQTQQPRKQTSGMSATPLYPEAAMGANRRP